MSTAQSMAKAQLGHLSRQICPVLRPSSTHVASPRHFHTSRPNPSAWPVGADGAEDDDYSHHRHTGASSSSSQTSNKAASLLNPSASATGSAIYSRTRAGPALEDKPNTLNPISPSNSHVPLPSQSGMQGKGKEKHVSPAGFDLPPPPRRKTIAYIDNLKRQGKPIACLTAYDYPTGLAIRSADIDICLVGDSLANVALGHATTQPLTLDAMIHHSNAVQRGLNASILNSHSKLSASPLVLADMPFGTFVSSEEAAVQNVIRLIQETGVDGVKIEGAEEVIPLIKRLTNFGIPVMGHLGLQPQRVGSTSGYRVQGKSAQQARDILESAIKLEQAGCFSVVFECVPNKLAKFISERLEISTIGIGAGNGTDGQILVMSDMLGELTSPVHVLAGLDCSLSNQQQDSSSSQQPPRPHPLSPLPPKFVRSFVQPFSLGAMRLAAVQAYVDAVRDKSFPDDHLEGYKMKPEEWIAFLELVAPTPPKLT